MLMHASAQYNRVDNNVRVMVICWSPSVSMAMQTNITSEVMEKAQPCTFYQCLLGATNAHC